MVGEAGDKEAEHRTEWGAGGTAGLPLLREVLPAGDEAVSHAGLRGQSSGSGRACAKAPSQRHVRRCPGRHSEEAGVAEAG